MQWVKRVFGGTASRLDGKPAVQSSLIMALEPRMMFDGAVAATAAAATDVAKSTDAQDTASTDKSAAAASASASASKDTSGASHAAATDSGQAAGSASGRNVVFVDSRVADAQQLLQGVAANTDVVFLERNGNGVQQMAQYLAAHPGAASVQIIAHGNDGDLWLGSSYVSAENIADYGNALTQLGSNMQAGGDILIYACNTAQGERGQTFVDELASLTGRDIAASNDRTGNGSDWDLEVTTGSIEARPVLSATSTSAYSHDLAIITVTNGADYGAGSLRQAILDAYAGDTVTFSSAMTVNLYNGELSIGKSLTIDGDLNNDGVADVTIDAHQTSRVLSVTAGTVKLDGLVLTGGLVSGAGGDFNSVNGKDALGAGLAVTGGTVTLVHSSVTGNAAAGGGGNGGGYHNIYGYGGGGGGGFKNVGGARGGDYSSQYKGATGGSGKGGDGGYSMPISNSQYFNGRGGTASGSAGLGGTTSIGLSTGGSGGSAGNASIGFIGAGGGGSGVSMSAGAGSGGAAAGGIYIAAGATLYVSSTTISNNLGAGGGGAGSGNNVSAGDGGAGVGGILNKGTLHYDTSAANRVIWQNNYGRGGQGGGNENGKSRGADGSGFNTGSESLLTTAGGTVDSTWRADEAPVNTTSAGPTLFTEGNNVASTPVVIDSAFTVSDADNTTLASATVSITGNFHGSEDVLAFANDGSTMGNIVGSYDSATGVLTLTSASATATLAQWQAALRSVTYTDTSDTPNTSTRTISFITNDGIRASNTAVKTVSVIAVNDTPIATTTGGSTAYVEGNNVTATVVVDSGITVSDLDSTTLASASVRIVGGFVSGQDVLGFSNVPATMGNIVGSYDSATGVLTLTSASATATLAQWQAALRSVTYANASDTPDTGNRTISFAVNDGSTASAAGSKTVTVASTNDSPVVTASGSTTAFVEGNNVTSTPVVIDSAVTVSDGDNGTLASATVAITGNFHGSEDLLAFANDGSTMGNIVGSYDSATGVLTLTSASASATLAQWQAALRAVTYTNSSETPNTSNRTISFSANDGIAQGVAAAKVVSVTAVNDTPIASVSGGTTAATENLAVIVDGGLSLSDLDSTTLASATVSVSGNFHSGEDVLAFANDGLTMGNIVGSYDSGTGVLTLTSASASATLAQWQAALRAVTYTDTSDAPNTANRTISFSVNDGSSSSVAVGKIVSVTAVNDAPVLSVSGGSASFVAGDNAASTPVAIDGALTVADPDNAGLASATVSIGTGFHSAEDVLAFSNDGSMGNIVGSYDSATGVLTLTSASATATLAQWQAALRSVTYTNTAVTPNIATRSIDFAVNDGALDSNVATRTVTVSATDQSPIVTTSGGSAAFVEGNNVSSTPVVVDSGVSVSDLDNATLSSAIVSIGSGFHSGEDLLAFSNDGSSMGNIVGSYDSATGVLTLTSASASATLAQWQAALRSVTYNNSSETPNTATRSIVFALNDGSKTSVAASRTLSVTATDDTPVLTSSGGTTAFTEGNNVTSTSVVVDSGLSVSDLDSATLSSATVSIGSGFHSDQDVLAFLNNNSSAFGNIVGSYNAGTGVLTLFSSGATATLAQWQAALRAVTYSNSSDNPDTATRTIAFKVNDGSSDSALASKTVSVTAVNDTPVVMASGGSASFVAGDNVASTPVAVDSGLVLSDLDSATLSSATVTIVGNFHSAEDLLAFSNDGSSMGNIVGSYDSATGVLTLTSANASATLAQWQAALRAVTYGNSAITPNTATRTLSFSVNDGTDASNSATRSVTVTAVDQTPVLTTGGSGSAFTKGGPAVAVDSGILVSDRDNSTLSSATVSITGGFQSGEDSLAFLNTNTSAFGNIVGSYNAVTGVLTLYSSGATASLAQWQNALAAVTYANSSAAPDTATRTVSFSVSDGSKTSAVATRSVSVLVNPTVQDVSSSSANGAYKVGDTVYVTVTFDQTVSVDTSGGTPSLLLETGAIDRNASYVSGSGSTTLTFAYTVQAGDQSSDLDFASSAALSLNGATIRNAGSDDAILTLASPGSAHSLGANKALVIDGVAPSVSSVSVPANGTYVVGQNLDFTVNYSEAVVVDSSAGTPYITVTLDTGGTVDALYVSGSGTSALTFRTVVGSGQQDTNGIALGASVRLNGGSLRDVAGNDALTTLNGVASTSSVLVDGIAPSVSGIARVEASPNNASSLHYSVSFSEAVSGLDISDFTLVGTGTASGVLSSVSQIDARTYSVLVTAVSGDGSLRLDLNGSGTGVTDLAGNALPAGLQGEVYTLDHSSPQVNSVSVPADGGYKAGELLSFTVNASESVLVDSTGGTPRLALTIGTSTVYADYVSGSGSSALVFQYRVQSGDNDADGITVGALSANGGTLRDAAGNDALLTLNAVGATSHVLVDTLVPTVTSVAVPGAGSYNAGDVLTFTVNASEALQIDSSSGTPRLALDIGGRTVYADYLSGSGGSALLFQYRVQAGDNDANGIGILALQANGGTLRDAAGNAAALTLNSVRDSRQVLVDTTAPGATAISRVEASPSGASSLHFDVTFSEAVDGLSLSSFALQSSGTASGQLAAVTRLNDLTWRVTVGNLSGDGNLSLGLRADNGIHDQAGNSLQQGLQGPAYVLDHTGPAVSAVQVPADGRYTAGQTLQFSVDFNDAVSVDTSGGVPRIAINLQQGGTAYATYVSGSGSNQLRFAYTVAAGQSDSDGIQLADVIQSNGGRLSDTLGNAADLNLGSLPSTRGLLVQGSGVNGDPQLRGDDGRFTPALPFGNGNPGNAPALPSPVQYAGPPALGLPPLLDTSNQGAAQSAFSSLFRNTPAQSQFALIFASNASNSSWGDGSGVGFLGFGGGDAGVYGESTLSSVFSAALEHEDQALSAFDHRGAGKGGLSGVFSAPGLGQQLHEMNQREQRQVADLARAFGEFGREGPAS